MLEPCTTVWLEGEPASEKSGGGFTTRVTVAAWLRVPLVPVIVRVELPVGVVLAVVTVMVEEPEVVTDVGLKLALAPAGNPEALKLTVPVNPFNAATVTV